MPRQVAKHIEVIAIYEQLQQVLKRTSEGLCQYDDGHDDKTVAEKVGVAISSVASLRRAKFGKVFDKNGDMRLREMSAEILGRMAELQNQTRRDMDDLRAKYTELQTKHDLLCTQLSASRITDARHLRIADPHERPANGAGR